ncbi:MAG: transposase [Deltaproteobacteria bacterium]|nr:transposase [Deltaproteobacteria bacterium]
MRQKSPKSSRRSIRLPGYDYSQVGAYFITICTQNRECLFGDIMNLEMMLNDAGRMLETVWNELPKFYARVSTDAFQIMPNHIHGIIVITRASDKSSVGAGPRACPFVAQSRRDAQRGTGQPQGVAPTGVKSGFERVLSLSDIVHRFKTMTTKRYSDGVKQHGWPSFPGKLWQRNYYEHIIRNENDMARIREYVINNPVQWDTDRENPMAKTNHNPSP